MEKSIESIWKKGFLNSDALVAPKLNNLYAQKSKHIIDKFNNMFRKNIIAIVISTFFALGFTYWTGIPYLGICMFFILNLLAIVNYKLWKSLEKINKNVDSFHYLKSFDGWMKEQVTMNRKFAKFMYPAFFLSILLGFWLGDFGGTIPGENLVENIITNYPNTILVFGLPIYGILAIIATTVLLIIFGDNIYNFDVKLMYGRIFNKLDELVADMEELRK
ncbi:MAG: hypothetical protein HQ522_10040 [Bacteroidetes bacterium]|nr:hypothetical protein [Bacteroidota bacterium]